MRNQRSDTPVNPVSSARIEAFKQKLRTQYGKHKGWWSTTLAGDGAILEDSADTLLQAIQDESTTPTILNMSFASMEYCAAQLYDLQNDTAMAFDDKETERARLHEILKHIQNVNRKIPTNSKDIQDEIRSVQAEDIWSDIDQIREDKDSENWANLKKALFVITCAIAVAIIITAMLTPVGWVGVGAFFIGMAVHFFIPYLMKVLGTFAIAAVTFGFMKMTRPIDTLAFESELSKRIETEMNTQKRASQDTLQKFHQEITSAEPDDATVDDASDDNSAAPLNQTPPRHQTGPSKHAPGGHPTAASRSPQLTSGNEARTTTSNNPRSAARPHRSSATHTPPRRHQPDSDILYPGAKHSTPRSTSQQSTREAIDSKKTTLRSHRAKDSDTEQNLRSLGGRRALGKT